jgi:hypothetical protein
MPIVIFCVQGLFPGKVLKSISGGGCPVARPFCSVCNRNLLHPLTQQARGLRSVLIMTGDLIVLLRTCYFGPLSSDERADSSPIRRQEDPPAESSLFGRAQNGPRHLSCSRTLDSDPHGLDRGAERKNGAYLLATAQNKMGSRAKPAPATNQQSPPKPVYSPCLFHLSFRGVEVCANHRRSG